MSLPIYRLMIKTHNITGLKYLCITKKKKYEKYSGSGIMWVRHLKKHGYSFSTEVLYESTNYPDFEEKCIYYSEILDVAKNKEFANIIPESGYDSADGISGNTNFEIFWEKASEEVKLDIFARRAETLQVTHPANSEDTREEYIKTLQIAANKRFEHMSLDERRTYTEKLRKGQIEWFANLTDEEMQAYSKSLSIGQKRRYSNMTEEDKQQYSAMMSQARLNTSEESKASRKLKIRAKYDTGIHDHLFERYSEERQGLNNPNAKIIVWMGKEYTKGKFEGLKIPKAEQEQMFSEREDCYKTYNENVIYEQLTCPHCNKKSNITKMPTAFKRWHMENCKERK